MELYPSFEFIASELIQTKNLKLTGPLFKKHPKYECYELLFLGASNEKIYRTVIKLSHLDIHTDRFEVIDGYFYSLDLIDIPLVVLNKTSRIDISRPDVIRIY